MSHNHHPEPNADRLAALLRSIDADAAPPDAALLAAIGLRAAAAFAESSAAEAGTERHADPLANSHGTPQIVEIDKTASTADQLIPMPDVISGPTPDTAPAPRRNTMFTLALKSFVGLVASTAALIMWFGLAPVNPAIGATPFSEVLAELRQAQTLQFKVSKSGESADVWVRAPGLVRREETPQRYQIAAGSRLWKIDESNNTAVAGDSTWFLSPDDQVDLLGLLDVGVTDAAALLTAQPVAKTAREGREHFIYRVEVPGKHGPLEIEAVADARTLQLVEITARNAGAPRQAGPPLAELQLVALNLPVADEKFLVNKSLTEDGRIGKVSQAQGIVVLRPMLARRWTPICRETLLKPGDWLRTELRGANAVKVTFSSDVELTLGPGTLVECLSPTQARIHNGTVQVMSPKQEKAEAAATFTLLAPKAGNRPFKPGDKQLVRVDRDEKLVDMPHTPVWLAGFEGTTNNESLGSLIVNLPDGRQEPLTVGYHKVSVEIRDQIARTTIEESFVNHTKGRLEGIFHFPLPQDASISGFGMWIGNDLVEADVVEKQRAREIYETILREKRDPGLLEWTGGNIFKARVFPIEARSEKRIKIVYTQVLPLRANRYRYSYGLRSELLRTNPLRELSLTVTVNSALPLKSISSPTHTVRTQQTAHSGQVEFAAQEYTPTRDFEVVCEIDGQQSDVVVVPHRRGHDGYFLMQLTPPTPDGNWQRELLPDGKPLSVVLLCDTSSSMDSEKRKQQLEFVGAVLSSLAADDRFLLGAADVGTVWAFPEAVAATPANVAQAQAFLDERISLGWTNLDRAFTEVVKKAPAGSQVIYIGDGIVSAGDTSPATFVQRLGQILTKGGARDARLGFHAVSVGNSFESVVLKGIAANGGGSVRAIGSEQTPQAVALELLNEIAQPGLRDLQVEYRGVKVAAVYPEQLPNVAAGTQQILVGRYLPEGKDQTGEVIVTGKRGNEPVRFAAKINLKDAEAGNSFIPRLWARGHLDHLLAQGSSDLIRDEIIRLSEEFHIITPYTSLLVLESDTDRERFGVQRRYEMRDGERFFAAGRDNAHYELLQQQMKRAGDWRLGLRRQVLQGLARLGRDSQAFQQAAREEDFWSQLDSVEWSAVPYRDDGPITYAKNWNELLNRHQNGPTSETYGFGAYVPSYARSAGGMLGRTSAGSGGYGGGIWAGTEIGQMGNRSQLDGLEFGFQTNSDRLHMLGDLAEEFDGKMESDKELAGVRDIDVTRRESKDQDEILKFDVDASFGLRGAVAKSEDWYMDDGMDGEKSLKLLLAEDRAPSRRMTADKKKAGGYYSFGRQLAPRERNNALGGSYRYRRVPEGSDLSWIRALFPVVEPPPSEPVVPVVATPGWSPAARELSHSLLRTESLRKLEGGLELNRSAEYFDPRWNRKSGRSSDLALYSPEGWLTHGRNAREQTLVSYCDRQERGLFSQSLLLGTSRVTVPADLKLQPLALGDNSLTPLAETYARYDARVEPAGEKRSRLILTLKDSTHVDHFLIDTERHVLLQREWFDDGQLTGSMTYSDFVEIGGSWWARTIITADGQGRRTGETKITIQPLTKEQYAERMKAELGVKPTVQFVRMPFVDYPTARQKVTDGSATFDEYLAIILYNAQFQLWDEMWKQVAAAEKMAVNKPGVRWLRTQLWVTSRRNEEARQALLEEAKQLAAKPQQDDIYLAERILGQAYGITGWPEFLSLVQILKPVYERPILVDGMPVEDPEVISSWNDRLLQCLDALNRQEESLALRKARATAAPWQLYLQTEYAQRLTTAGQFAAAHAWLRQEIARPERNSSEDETLRTVVADTYRQQYQWAELLKWTTEWIARNPESDNYYNSPYTQHLTALICNDQIDQAYALGDQWLKEACVDGKLSKLQRVKLEAALNFANGSLPTLNFQRMNPRWFAPLSEAARFFVRYPHHFDLLQRCVTNHYFLQTATSDQLRAEWFTLLQTQLDRLTPSQIHTLVGWTLSGRMDFAEPLNGRKQLDGTEIPKELWQKISTELLPRWEQTTEAADKHLLSETLRLIYATRFADSQLLPFLRQRIGSAPADYRPAYVSALFEQLLVTPWSAAIEQETFAVWRTLFTAPEPMKWSDDLPPAEVTRLRKLEEILALGNRLSVEVPTLHRIVDSMLANRVKAAEQQLNDQGEQDKLTRQQLAAKKAEFHKLAKEGLAKRLAAEEAQANEPVKQGEPARADLAGWIRIERLWLDVQLGQNLEQVETECWKILGEAPSKAIVDVAHKPDNSAEIELTDARSLQDFFAARLKERAFAMVMNLAVRKTGAAASIDRLLKYIDAGIALHRPLRPNPDPAAVPASPAADETAKKPAPTPEEARLAAREAYIADVARAWKLNKFRLLVALDRPDDLDRALREWIRTDVSTAPWRQWLARLVAERGQLNEAIQLLEACEKDKLLSAEDYGMLANWYLVSDRREAYERSRIESFKQMQEGQLSQMIYQIRNRWNRNGAALPSELDEKTLFVYKALFEKSSQPEQYLYLLRELYGACRDFRLLQMLPDAVLGRSPQQIYNYLQTLHNQVLVELRNEASADEILTRIQKLRENPKLTTIDLRALDLLEAVVERKSAEILNQPGPHIDACLAALQRAFQRQWSDGEPRMMSGFLVHLGGLPHEKLRTEQLREVRELQKLATAASRDHLLITADLCHLLFWQYNQKDEAIREMEVEALAYAQANQGFWPHPDDETLSRFIALYEGANRDLTGESILKKHLAKPQNDEQQKWLNDRLMSLYNHALEHNNAVSIGANRDELFSAIVALSLKELDAAADENVRYNLVSRLNSTFDIANRHKVPAVVPAVHNFAFEVLPRLLKKQQSQYANTATNLTYLISQVLGPKLGLQYIVERMEQFPQRLEIQWSNSWQSFGSWLAQTREAAGSTDLDPRVLQLAVRQLKTDLQTGESHNPYIYRRHYSHFWAEKTADFAKAAEEVLNESRNSGRVALAVARYLRDGLGLLPRAIEILLIAHKAGLLEESAQYELAQWLREANRYGEMIALLEPLVNVRPDNMSYRTLLMVAYHHSQRPEQLVDLIGKTHEHFHAGGRWTEAHAAQFAQACLGTDQWERAKMYFTEVIALHQRANPGSGLNDSVLSEYYQNLARSESRLEHTVEAVSAASAAIVCWDARHEHRNHALNTLREVISAAKNLDGYVAHLDAEAAKTGQDSPILRKAVGQIYQSRKEHAKALVQLQLALQLQPNDRETHQALIAGYDATGNATAATHQLLQLIDLNQHDLELYKQLATRLQGNEAEAERAATSIIESAPNEAESHAALAEIRQQQNRWAEAIPHWQQVSQLRRLEPTGLIKLAEAQLHEKQWDGARQTLEKLQRTPWPSRFADVDQQTRRLQDQLPK